MQLTSNRELIELEDKQLKYSLAINLEEIRPDKNLFEPDVSSICMDFLPIFVIALPNKLGRDMT